MTNAATRDIGRRIPPAADREELAQILVDAVAGELELEGSAVWLAEEQTGRFILTAQAGYQGEQLPQELPFPSYPVSNQPIRLKGSAPTPHWLAPLENHLSLEVVMPLYHEAEPVALLGYGRRWDEDIFDERDLVVIELIGQQALLYLQVSRQIEELRQMPHLVSAAQERERTLLAAELHDTIQQFLGRLPFFLVASKEAMLDDPEEAGALLERSLGDIEEAAIAVQRIRQNLAPNQLERSLTRSLSALAAHDNQRYGLKVALDIAGDIDEATDLEARHALYRVIQHALDNVAAHAGTQDVAIRLAREDGRVTFAVVDDGNGASTEDLWQAQSLGHFGLQSMQARMEACGGELSLKTAPGLGMEVSGWAPAADSSDSA